MFLSHVLQTFLCIKLFSLILFYKLILIHKHVTKVLLKNLFMCLFNKKPADCYTHTYT